MSLTWQSRRPESHLQRPDFNQSLQRWQARIESSNRRVHSRYPIASEICLTAVEGGLTFTARTDNISSGGAHVTLPGDTTFRPGDKLQVQMSVSYQFNDRVMVQQISSRAAVLRVEMLLGEDRDRLGIALGFDQPQFLPL